MTRVAYLTSAYPTISHTFIEREIAALRARGVEVRTLTIRRQPEAQLLSERDRRNDADTFAILPIAPSRLLRAHVRAFVVRPRRYLRTLGSALSLSSGGARELLWQIFYFAESIVVWDLCRREDIRHIHAHFANVAAAVARLAAIFGTPDGIRWSFTMHGPTEFEDVTRFALAEKVRSAAFVACISDFCRSQLMRLSEPEQWSKLTVVRCGLNLDEIAIAEPREVGGPLRVLSIGRLVPEKGQRILLEALAELRRRRIDVAAVLVGAGPERERLAQAARELGVEQSVSFPGALGQERVHELLSESDIFCLPSFAEGLPVVLMEAMAHGLPVVCTRIAGVAELVEDGRSGLMVTPGRSDELARSLAVLAADAEKRTRMGQAGRQRVSDGYQIAASAQRLEELFEQASREAV